MKNTQLGNRDRLRRLALCALILLAGLLAYGNSFTGAFVFDDHRQIIKNPAIESFWTIWPTTAEVRTSLGRRRPVTHLTLAVNYAVGGVNPTLYHVFNLAVHLLAGLTLFGLVGRTLQRPQFASTYGNSASYLAFAVALIWTIHPLGTQSVTYVIQRCESLMGLCYLVSLYCTMRGSQSSRSVWWYVGAFAVLCVGMGTKEVMFTAPLVILLYDRVFLSDSWQNLFRRRWGLYLAFLVPLVVLGMAVAPALVSDRESTVGFGQRSLSSWEYLSSQPGVILHYLRLAFWPEPLCLDYGWPVARTSAAIYLPGALIVGLVLASLWALYYSPSIGFLGLTFFIILSPTSSFVPITDLAFEHRMYLPLAAVVVLVVLACEALSRCMVRNPRARITLAVAALVIVVVPLMLRTFDRNRDYQDPVVLWQDVLQIAPHNARAHVNLAAALVRLNRLSEDTSALERALNPKRDYVTALTNLGDVSETQESLNEAATHLRQAVRLRPDFVSAHNRLGIALTRLGNLDDAASSFERALRLRPDYVEAINNLGFTLLQQGKLDEAAARFETALGIRPDDADAHNNLALVLTRRGDWEQAVAHYEDALRLMPDNAQAHNNFGALLQRRGDLRAAEVHYERAIRIKPDFADARSNLGSVLHKQGKLSAAAAQLEKAIRIRPDFADAHNNLGAVLDNQGKLVDAVAHYEQAIRFNANYAEAHLNLGVARGKQGNLAQAIAHFQRALAIRPDFVEAHVILGDALLEQGNDAEGAVHLEQAIRLQTDLAQPHDSLGGMYLRQGNLREAIVHYREALRLEPDLLAAANNLAWVLATSGDSSLRNGPEAVRWAERSSELTDQPEAGILDTLAAAYAEAGRWDEALATARQAIELATAAGQETLAGQIEARLQLYLQRKPFRAEPAD